MKRTKNLLLAIPMLALFGLLQTGSIFAQPSPIHTPPGSGPWGDCTKVQNDPIVVRGTSDADTCWDNGNNNDVHYKLGEGGDTLFAGSGHDFIEAGKGPDDIHAADGADTVRGMDGNDKIQGGHGHDDIYDNFPYGDDTDEVWPGDGGDVVWVNDGDTRDLVWKCEPDGAEDFIDIDDFGPGSNDDIEDAPIGQGCSH